MSAIDRAFSAATLRFVLADVRRHDPAVNIKESWVWKHRPGKYEFHYRKFYWYGSADSAADARAAGWNAWLREQGAEGYAA